MKYNDLRFSKWRLGMVALFALTVPSAPANDGPLVSGSYQVVQRRDLDSQSQIQVRIHLVNHGSSNLAIQRVTLWDLSHPGKGGSSACSLVLRAHDWAETTQQFTILGSDYQSWQQGFRPRLVLQMAGPGRTRNRTVVRLDRISGREAK